MSHQVVTRTERIKLFVREYYTGNTAWTNTVRIIGGPFVIGCGIYLYPEPSRFAIGYGGFCFFYGIYYLLKPALIIALRPSLFQTSTFDLQVDKQELTLQEEGVKSTIRFDLFKSILRQSEYYSLKLPDKMTIYFKISQLSADEINILDKHLTS